MGYHAGKPIDSVVYCLNLCKKWQKAALTMIIPTLTLMMMSKELTAPNSFNRVPPPHPIMQANKLHSITFPEEQSGLPETSFDENMGLGRVGRRGCGW